MADAIYHEHVWKNKSEGMRSSLDLLCRIMGWDGEMDHCRVCNAPITGFNDELSENEYYISGMCQQCQDETFCEPEDDDE